MIKDFKDLEKLFKLCRKQGIYDMDFNGIKFKLGELPTDPASPDAIEKSNQMDGFPTGILTQEQLMFYSAGGLPENDPFLKEVTQ